jgi:beta-glucanase (GH16 family)
LPIYIAEALFTAISRALLVFRRMLVLISRILSIVAIKGLYTQAQNQSDISTEEFHEAFREDFETNTINTTRWNIAKANLHGKNGANRHYLSENVIVRNDNYLHLLAQTGKDGDAYINDPSNSRIDTGQKYHFLYGEIEWKASVSNGQGFIASVSLVHFQSQVADGNCWPTVRIQYCYLDGYHGWEIIGSVFWKTTSNRAPSKRSPADETMWTWRNLRNSVGFSSGFHVYKLVWLPHKLAWYVDGQEIFNETDPQRIPSVSMQVGFFWKQRNLVFPLVKQKLKLRDVIANDVGPGEKGPSIHFSRINLAAFRTENDVILFLPRWLLS